VTRGRCQPGPLSTPRHFSESSAREPPLRLLARAHVGGLVDATEIPRCCRVCWKRTRRRDKPKIIDLRIRYARQTKYLKYRGATFESHCAVARARARASETRSSTPRRGGNVISGQTGSDNESDRYYMQMHSERTGAHGQYRSRKTRMAP